MNKELKRRWEMEVVVAKFEVLLQLLPDFIRVKQVIFLI
jgi:hypothetical protein